MAGNTIPTGVLAKIICKRVLLFIHLLRGIGITKTNLATRSRGYTDETRLRGLIYHRALNTLRYIHANPKATGMQAGFFYDFSNYGTYDRLTDDGLTQWHPAFLSLGNSLSECAAKYRGFCKKYKPQPKPEKSYHWGSKLLPKVIKHKGKKTSPGQMRLPWVEWEFEDWAVREVAEQFVVANCYDSARYRNF